MLEQIIMGTDRLQQGSSKCGSHGHIETAGDFRKLGFKNIEV
jgi:hypothetical protein